jgi:hypothetical protein
VALNVTRDQHTILFQSTNDTISICTCVISQGLRLSQSKVHQQPHPERLMAAHWKLSKTTSYCENKRSFCGCQWSGCCKDSVRLACQILFSCYLIWSDRLCQPSRGIRFWCQPWLKQVNNMLGCDGFLNPNVDNDNWPKAENSFNQSEFWNISYGKFYSTIVEDSLRWSRFIFCLSKLDFGCESYEIQRI